MSQSNEIPEVDELPDVDYSDIPPEIEEVITGQRYTVQEKVKLTWDGNQYLSRIPTEIAEELNLTSDSRMRFTFNKPLPGSAEIPEVEVKLCP